MKLRRLRRFRGVVICALGGLLAAPSPLRAQAAPEARDSAPTAAPVTAPAPPPPANYTLVLRDGRHLTALGTPRYSAEQAVWFTPDGRRTETKVTDIDLLATLMANQTPDPSAPAAEPVLPVIAADSAPTPPVEAAPPTPSQTVLYHSEGGLGGFHAISEKSNRGAVVTGSFGRYDRTKFFRVDVRFDNYLVDIRFRSQKGLLGSGRYYIFTDNIFKEDEIQSLNIRASLGKGLGIVWSAEDRGLPDYVRQRTFESELGIYFQVENLLNETSRRGLVKFGTNLDFYLDRIYLETKTDLFISPSNIHDSRLDVDQSISWGLTRNERWRVKGSLIGEYLFGNRPTGRAFYYRLQAGLVYQFRSRKKVAVKALAILDPQ